MKKYLSMLLIFAFVIAELYVQPITTRGDALYNDCYGNQLGNSQENFSRKIYDELVKNYVYQENDDGNSDGRYTGLAEPLKNNGEIAMALEEQTFSEITETKEEFEADVLEWFEPMLEDMNESLIAAVDAFVYDHPQVFWIKSMKIEASIKVKETPSADHFQGEATVSVVLKPTEYSEGMSENIVAFNDAVCAAKNEIIRNYGISESTHKADIARYLQDYVATKAQYNFDAAKNPENASYTYAFTPLPVFLENDLWNASVVCEGYSKSFMILCEQFGLECALLVGQSINFHGEFEYHEWNAVQLDGKWYAVDVTWDDQETGICYNYFLAGKNSKGFYKYTYKEDHIEENVFSDYENSRAFILPEISDESYYFNGETTSDTQNTETTSTPTDDGDNTTKPGDQNELTKPGDQNETTESGDANNPTQSGNENNSTQSGNKGEQTTQAPGVNGSGQTIKYHWIISGVKKSVTYTGKQIKQQFKVTFGQKVLKEGKDYKVSYKNNINSGKARMVLTPIGEYRGLNTITYEYTISKVKIKNVSAKKIKKQKYKNGKAIKPKVTLKYNGKKLKKGKDYTVSYKNNKKKGTGKIVIKGKGNFKGQRIIKFKIR